MQPSRRQFIAKAGVSSLLPLATTSAFAEVLKLSTSQRGLGSPTLKKAFTPLPFTTGDTLTLAKGFKWQVVAKADDVINRAGDRFGDCADYTHFFPGPTKDQGFLWVNHEYHLDYVSNGKAMASAEKTKAAVDAEMRRVGGSYIEVRRQPGGMWQLYSDSTAAFRIDAHTPIPLVGPAGGRTAMGTVGNCGGGFTPWGTVLTAEENVENDYHASGDYGWKRFHDRPEADYCWVVEVDPATKSARKLTSLGRLCHESATVVVAKDKRVVVYMGEDSKAQCVYKFVSSGKLSGNPAQDKDLLLNGDLFVADIRNGRWQPLRPDNAKLAKDAEGRFRTQGDIVRQMRAAGHAAGGTKLNRPEDIEVHPVTGMVFISLTNNDEAGDYHGTVIGLEEDGGDHTSDRFKVATLLTGGSHVGLSCPDNLILGPDHSLWVCTDVSWKNMGDGPHQDFPRNSMFRVEADRFGNTYARHFLQAPPDAELTGPSFTPDNKSLFISVQHPGESSYVKATGLTSHWPDGGLAVPKSAVIVVEETSAAFNA